MRHTGTHNHDKPPPAKMPMASRVEFEKIVKTAPELTPSQLKLGSSTRHPVTSIHPSLHNKDWVSCLRRKILKPTGMNSSMAALVNFQKKISADFIRDEKLSTPDAHIIMQNQDMIELVQLADSPLQTDSVEGFIVDADFEGQINVTFSSAFDCCLQKWVPVCISILFGKTSEHHKAHWSQMFQCCEDDTWKGFLDHFPGNTSDFSDAMRNGFFEAVKAMSKTRFNLSVMDEDIAHACNFAMFTLKDPEAELQETLVLCILTDKMNSTCMLNSSGP